MRRPPMSLDDPTPVSRRATMVGIVAAIAYLVIAALIFALEPDEPWVASPPFVLAHALTLAILSGLVSLLLYAHAARTGNAGYLTLAGAFASMVVFMAVFPLAFPGAVIPVSEESPGGLVGSPQTTIATFFTWHAVLYAALPLSSILIARGSRERRKHIGALRIARSVVLWIVGAGAFVFVAIAYPGVLPTLVGDAGITPLSVAIGWLLVVLAVGGLVLVSAVTRARSPISRWIIAVLIVSIGEALVAVGSERYSTGWYFNRAFGIAALTFLVLFLAWEIARADQPSLRTTSYDFLTQIMTRATFERTLEELAPSGLAQTQPIALMWIDLDDFQSVNARLGHQAADSVLRVVARRMQDQLAPHDLIARVGGDEFAVAVFGSHAERIADSTAQHLVREVARPIDISGQRVTTTCSIGIALAPSQATALADLAHKSDIAMREAKSRGGNRVSHYLPGLGERERRNAELRVAIQDAIAVGEFVPYAQPVVNVRTSEVVGLEILARWERQGTTVPMADVIEVAETSRLIVPIGEQVRAATAPSLPELFDAHPTLRFVSFNFAVAELTDGSAMASLMEPPWLPFADRLVIEITEGTALYASSPALTSLEALRSVGYRLAIDDYGVGFSTIARLQQLGATIVKSDHSLLRRRSDLSADPKDLIRVVYDISRALKGTLIVEGVETKEEEAIVRGIGPVFAQGYLYGRPSPLADWLQPLRASGA